ncbi:MAG: Lrp/AsnC ligand binding domain-containing protein, partial [Bacillota bacterium]
MGNKGIPLFSGQDLFSLLRWEKASNKDMVIALIDVKVTPQRDVGFDQLAAKIYKYPEVREIFLMSGSYDFS